MTPDRAVIIVGAGIAGLSAAVAMKQAGYAVRVFERSAAIELIGAALSIWGNAIAVLDQWGCGNAIRATAAPVTGLRQRDHRDRTRFGPVDLSDTDSWLPMRRTLQATLLEAVGADRVTLGTEIADIRDTGDRVAVVAADGKTPHADLAIIADGIHSAHATRLIGNAPTYRGYRGFLGLSPHSAGMPTGMGEEIWNGTERVGLFSTHEGGSYWFWMASATEDERIAHDAIHARVAWPKRARAAIDATPTKSLIPISIHARDIPKRMDAGRLICIGDAAHAMEPNLGQGACMAIEDAYVLGRLAERLAPEQLLAPLEKARLPRVAHKMRVSARLGAMAHRVHPAVQKLGAALTSLSPASLERRQIRREIAPMPELGG